MRRRTPGWSILGNTSLSALFLLTAAAVANEASARTPDGQTPAREDVCDELNGKARGLCNAYCEAMDCDSDSPRASAQACEAVKRNFARATGDAVLPCLVPKCPYVTQKQIVDAAKALAPYEDKECFLEVDESWVGNYTVGIEAESTTGGELEVEIETYKQCTEGGVCSFDHYGFESNITPEVEFTDHEVARACGEVILSACRELGFEIGGP